MIFCCGGFKRLLSTAGEKGFSVIASWEGNKRVFCLQARPFESHVVEKYSAINPETGYVYWPELRDIRGVSVPYTIEMETLISYCPFCGRDLTDLINIGVTQLNRYSIDFIEISKNRSKY